MWDKLRAAAIIATLLTGTAAIAYAQSSSTVGMGGSLVGVHWSLAVSAAALLVITLGLFAYEMRPEMPKATG